MYNDRFEKFLQLIFKVSQSSWTDIDDAQQNYPW